ncbi:MAG: phosphatase PAP2 family protein [Bacteroidia bacterium]|nr:phosphatase PAP2 family protein [Bacteroidia bacterium]
MHFPISRYIFLICFMPLLVMGQADSASPARQASFIDKGYLKSYLTDARDIAISPLRWNTFRWIGASAVVGTTVLLFTQDGLIQEFVQGNRTPSLDKVSRYLFEPIGSGLYSLSAMGILYGCGLIWHNDRAKLTALKGVEAFILAGISNQIIKHLTHRHRPYQDEPPNPELWEGPFQGFDYTSFPSAHASSAFAIATVVATSYKHTIWVPIVCYTLATGAALSRVYDNKHWASDILIGSVVGFAIGKLVVRNEGKLKVLPASPTGPGISLVYPF